MHVTEHRLTVPLDHDEPGGETIEMNTTGLASNPVFTSLGIDFDIGLLSLTSLFVNMQVTDPGGFAQGTYTAKTVLTCS